MDPKQHQLSKLDPKLKEAYERVMSGIPASSPPQPADGAAVVEDISPSPKETTSSTIDSSHPSSSPMPAIATSSEPNLPEKESVQTTTTPISQSVVSTPISSSVNSQKIHLGYQGKAQKIGVQKKKTSIPPSVYIFGGVVFFVLYTLFWIKVFNIPLPFLP